jgi:hypothetical protein
MELFDRHMFYRAAIHMMDQRSSVVNRGRSMAEWGRDEREDRAGIFDGNGGFRGVGEGPGDSPVVDAREPAVEQSYRDFLLRPR